MPGREGWLWLALAVSLLPGARAGEPCFLKDGDRVGFFGDSITEAKVYARATEQVFRHFHPDARVTFINNGHSGLQLAGTRLETVIQGDPNVVAIMIGMNDAINGSWVRGMPVEPLAAQYQARLMALVQELKALGKVVVILTPTLTDESPAMSCFMTEGTRSPLAAMGRACEAVAREASVACVPVQAEFEDYEASLPRFAILRPDGVHPCARGHYQMARSLWTHLNLAGPLEGGRTVAAGAPELDVALALATNILPANAEALTFTLAMPKPAAATVTWSQGAARGREALDLRGQATWTLALPRGALPQTNGSSATIVIDVESQGARRVFLVDVFRKGVIHGADGKAAGTITDTNGVALCSYQFRKEGRGLIFEATVKKAGIVQGRDDQWPWGNGDALTLYLDIRKAPALGGLGFDGDVYQVWFKPRDTPMFTPGFHPWSGKHMANIATPFGGRTADSYTVGVELDGYVNIKERFDVSDRRLIGCDLSLVYAQAPGRKTWIDSHPNDRQNFLFPGSFGLIDLYGDLKGEAALTASVFPGAP